MKKRGRKLKLTKKLRIPKRNYEQNLQKQGYTCIAGVDEVGRGALAGPLVAAAVILPKKNLYKIRDSKLLSEKERESLAKKIKKEALAYAIGDCSVLEIEKLGLQKATYKAYERAISKLKRRPDFLLVDAYKIPHCPIPYLNLKKGDLICASISAASILAKDFRDKLMKKLHKKYPQFRFDLHKGYGTALHLAKLKKYKPCPIHRREFSPIKKLIKKA